MAVIGKLKEAEAFQRIHGNEHQIVIGNFQEQRAAEEQIDRVRRECQLRMSFFWTDLKYQESFLDIRDQLMELLGRESQSRIMILSDTGGVQKDGVIVPMITHRKIKDLFEEKGEWCFDPPAPDIRHALQLALAALGTVPSVTICRGRDYTREFYSYMGAGTMCAREDSFKIGSAHEDERPIFDAVVEDHSRIFRPREQQDWDVAFGHHHFLRTGAIPIGGASLIPQPNDTQEFGLFWSEVLQQGIGRKVISDVVPLSGHQLVYALTESREAGHLFTSTRLFTGVDRLQTILDEGGTRLPERLRHLMEYSRDRLATKPELMLYVGNQNA
jgi:hypothetical protein